MSKYFNRTILPPYSCGNTNNTYSIFNILFWPFIDRASHNIKRKNAGINALYLMTSFYTETFWIFSGKIQVKYLICLKILLNLTCILNISVIIFISRPIDFLDCCAVFKIAFLFFYIPEHNLRLHRVHKSCTYLSLFLFTQLSSLELEIMCQTAL